MRLERYIVFEWFKIFALALVAIFGILLLGAVQDQLGDLLEWHVATLDILKYFVLLTPTFLPEVLPISFLVSLLFSLGQLHKNHEITAMRATGMSLWKITRGLWAAGLLLGGALFYLNAAVVPRAVETTRTLRQNFEFQEQLAQNIAAEEVGLIYNLTFYNHAEGRIWFINRFNEYNFRAYGVTVSALDERGRELRRTVANEAYFDDIARNWVFQNGREMTFDPGTGDPIRSLAFDERVLTNFTEEPDLMKFLEKRPKDLSFFQLGEVLSSLGGSEDPRLRGYAVQYYSILFNPLVCIIMVGLAVPFAITGVRTNPMVGVSKAIGLFFMYYLALNVSNVMFARLVDPVIAAFLPNAMMVGVALFVYIRSVRPQ